MKIAMKNDQSVFAFMMESYDGTEISGLVGLYILIALPKKFGKQVLDYTLTTDCCFYVKLLQDWKREEKIYVRFLISLAKSYRSSWPKHC